MKVAIVGGAGGVGSSVAYNLLRGAVPHEVLIVDTRENMVLSHVYDLQDVLGLGAGIAVRAAKADETLSADVVVISAAVPLRLNTSRNVFLNENAAVVAGVVDPLAAAGWGGVLVVMTNPVDPLVTWVQRRTGWDRSRILGYTYNDTLRLRSGVALATGRPVQQVEAWVLGEHGAGQVPVFSQIKIAGQLVELSADERAAALDYINGWYTRHVALDSGRTSTWTSGAGGAEIVNALTLGRDAGLLPTSVVLDGQYGIDDVSLTTLVRFGESGAAEIVELPVDDAERDALHASARQVAALVDAIGLPD